MPLDDPKHMPIKDVYVGDVMKLFKQEKPATVSKDATLSEAMDAMINKSKTRKVYVVDAEGKLLGTITLETLLRYAGYQLGVRKTGITSFFKMLAEIREDKASKVMTTPAKVLQDEIMVNAMMLMVENHLNDLPVVDHDNRLIGELNGLDILRYVQKISA